MTAARQGVGVVGAAKVHASAGGLVEVWRARCEEGALGEYVSLDPRIFIVLDPLQAEISLGGCGDAASDLHSASFVPAGAPLRLEARGATEIRHLDLHFDIALLGPIEGVDEATLRAPRLMFADERVSRLARLLDLACARPDVTAGLYGDALVTALVAAVFAPGEAAVRRTALSDRQLRLAIGYIEDRCAEPIRLEDLASLTGLTPSYFSHAFKAATGMPPHRWQLQARVRRAKAMLAETSAALTEVAGAAGFSDQPHFTRVFKRLTGQTPLSWRAASLNRARKPEGDEE